MLECIWLELLTKVVYRKPRESVYSRRFFGDLSSGYSYYLGKKGIGDFYKFVPENCKTAELIKSNGSYDLSNTIEELVYAIISSLVTYGRAIVYIDKNININEDGEKIISSIQIGYVRGLVHRTKKDKCMLHCISFDGKLKSQEVARKQIIQFRLRDIGMRNNYFAKINDRLAKNDITEVSSELVASESSGYDFLYHNRKSKINAIRLTHKIGWTFGFEDLSDSQIIYNKIIIDKLRIKLLEYTLLKLNDGLRICLGEDAGQINAEVKDVDYDLLWDKFQRGEISFSEINDVLFQ